MSLSSTAATNWIIDTGATDHITSCYDLLINPTPVQSYIHLPIGQKSRITHIGTIHLTYDITLSIVLYVPRFTFNMLSGSKLTSTSIPFTRPARNTSIPAKYLDYIGLPSSFQSPTISTAARYPSPYSLPNYISYSQFSSAYSSFCANISQYKTPTTYAQAKKNPLWCASMNDELNALVDNNTWILQLLPLGKHIVGCKCLFKTKANSDGILDKKKVYNCGSRPNSG